MSDFAEKTALVTGAASGLGAVVVEQLVERGARVAAVDVDGAKLKERFQPGPQLLILQGDVSEEADVSEIVDQTVDHYSRIDLLHNNAGVLGVRRPIVDLDVEDFDATIKVNVRGMFLVLRGCLRHMSARPGGGSIVNTSSIAGLGGSPNIAPYVTSKHAIVGLTKTAALEAGAYGVRVNAICPAAVDTPLLWKDTSPDRMARRMPEVSPLGRVADPAEIAALVLWLLSDTSSFVTGSAYPIDGGQTASAG